MSSTTGGPIGSLKAAGPRLADVDPARIEHRLGQQSVLFRWGHQKRWAKRRELPVFVEDPVIWIEIGEQTVGIIKVDGIHWSWGQPSEKLPETVRAAGPLRPWCDCATQNGGVCRRWQQANSTAVALVAREHHAKWLYERMNNRPPVPCVTTQPKADAKAIEHDAQVDHMLAFAEAYVEAHAAKLLRHPLQPPSKQVRYRVDNYVPGNLIRLCDGGPFGHVVSVRGQRVEWLQFGQRYPVIIRKSDDHVRVESAHWSDEMRQHSTWGAWRHAQRAERDSKGRFVSHKSTGSNSSSPLDATCADVGEVAQGGVKNRVHTRKVTPPGRDVGAA